MFCYPNGKINLGLKILSKRKDGFHNINSLFLPITLCDILEVIKSPDSISSEISYSGIQYDPGNRDLILKAFDIISSDFDIENVRIHIHKNIPVNAGLGGGSSNGMFMLKILNDLFNLDLHTAQLLYYAKMLGSDCPFFLLNKSSIVTGLGDKISPIKSPVSGYQIVIIKPPINCRTSDIFNKYHFHEFSKSISYSNVDINNLSKYIDNDLELVSLKMYPELNLVKEYLYSCGAIYSGMTGSGSSIYGIFKPMNIVKPYKDYWFWSGMLS